MSRRRGFTLIELLVVIAIIGILAAMLFPVFARARESARKIQCLSNVKNLAMALQMYLSDYDAFPPGQHNQTALDYMDSIGCSAYQAWTNDPYLRWPVILDEYVKNRDIYRCPSAKWNFERWLVLPDYYPGGWLGAFKKAKDNNSLGSIRKGFTIGACDCAFPTGWGGAITDSVVQLQMGGGTGVGARAAGGDAPQITIGYNEQAHDVKLSSVGDPSWYVVCADIAAASEPWLMGRYTANPTCLAQAIIYETCMVPCGGTYASACSAWGSVCGFGSGAEVQQFHTDPSFRSKYTRHLGGSNVGFADGHAKWFTAEALDANRPYCTGCCGGVVITEEGRKLEGVCTSPLP